MLHVYGPPRGLKRDSCSMNAAHADRLFGSRDGWPILSPGFGEGWDRIVPDEILRGKERRSG